MGGGRQGVAGGGQRDDGRRTRARDKGRRAGSGAGRDSACSGLLGQRSIHARAREVQRGTGRAAVQGGDLGTAAQLLAVALAHARGKGLCGFAGLGTAGLVVDDEPAVLGAERKVDDGDLAGGVDQRPFSARAGLGQQPLAARVGQGGLQRFQRLRRPRRPDWRGCRRGSAGAAWRTGRLASAVAGQAAMPSRPMRSSQACASVPMAAS